MANVTRYVVAGLATGLGDGTSEANAYDGIDSLRAGITTEFSDDLVTADVNLTVICSNPSDLNDACEANFSAVVMDATRHITFQNSNPAQPYKITTPTSSTGYAIRCSGSAAPWIFERGFEFFRDVNLNEYEIVDARASTLQIDGAVAYINTITNSGSGHFVSATLSGAVEITNSIMRDFGKTGAGAAASALEINNYNANNKSINNTYIDCGDAIECVNGTVKSRNDIFQNNTNDTTGTGTFDVDYALTDAVSIGGANSVTSTTLTFVDAANDDYHLAAGDTAAIGAGVGPATDSDVPTTDYDGDTRSGTTTDIGADLYASASFAIDSTDASMTRDTNFQVVCSNPATTPTTSNTTLSQGGDTLTCSSVTGSDPYTLTFPVGDLSKQVDATGYDWTLTVDAETAQTGNIPLNIQSGYTLVDLTLTPNTSDGSLLYAYTGTAPVLNDHLEYDVTSTLDSGVSLSVAADGVWTVTETNPGDWFTDITVDRRVVQQDGTIGATAPITLSVAGGGGFATYKAWMESLSAGSFTQKLRDFLEGQGHSGSTTKMLYEYLKAVSSKSSHQERKKEWEDGGWG